MIPDYQSVMLPLLRLSDDGAVHAASEAVERLAKEFALTDAELEQLIPSGTQSLFYNRVGWALSYLKKAGTLIAQGRGKFSITLVGKQLLASRPLVVNNKILAGLQLSKEPLAFNDGEAQSSAEELANAIIDDKETPEERIARAQEDLDAKLFDDLFDRLQAVSWQFFERLVLKLLVAMGYGGARSESALHIGGSGDQGIDGLINEDRLGLDRIYVQAKKWSDPVGSRQLQGFVGALAMKNARKGVFFTTSRFTSDARDFIKGAGNYSIALIDGHDIAKLMIQHGVGTRAVRMIPINQVDGDFFAETVV